MKRVINKRRQPTTVLLVATAALFLLGSTAAHASLQNTSQNALPTLSELIKLADQGNAVAQLVLGMKYSEGDGVRQDYAEAMKWFRKAADQGEVRSQFNLAIMYENGQSVPQNYVEAMKWYRKAADQGGASAQINLGVMYFNGHGVPQDYAEAMKWYRKAADQGDTTAEFIVGLNYTRGKGIPRDYVQAYMWLQLVAIGASGDTQREAAEQRDAFAILMTREQIAEAQRLAREWKPTKAK